MGKSRQKGQFMEKIRIQSVEINLLYHKHVDFQKYTIETYIVVFNKNDLIKATTEERSFVCYGCFRSRLSSNRSGGYFILNICHLFF